MSIYLWSITKRISYSIVVRQSKVKKQIVMFSCRNIITLLFLSVCEKCWCDICTACVCSVSNAGPIIDCHGRHLKTNELLNYELLTLDRPLNELILSKNNIALLPTNELRNLKHLKILDLSQNQLESTRFGIFEYLSDLEDLDYSRNLIQSFDLSVLNSVLFRFNLSYNRINSLENGLEGAKTKLKIFDVSRNNISNLNFLNALPELQYLDLSFNRLSTLSDSLFGLRYLEVLRLDNNQLLSLNFQHLPPSLLELNAKNNLIDTLSFQKSSVYTLNIQNNQISKISRNLTLLTKLKHLNISGNSVSNLPDVFLERLEVLDLSFNNLTIIPETASVKNFPNLRIFKVNGNRLKDITLRSKLELESFEANYVETIERIDENAFLMLREKDDCINVTISNNVKLSSIAENVFHHMHICSLDLSNNHFAYLPFELFKTYVYGKHFSNANYLIDLQENPFICDCSLQWMLDELVPRLYTIKPSLLEDLRCAGPPPLMNKRMIHWYKWEEKVFCDDISHYAEKMTVDVAAVSSKQIVTFESSPAMIAVLASAIALLVVLTLVGVLLTRGIAKKRRRANRRF